MTNHLNKNQFRFILIFILTLITLPSHATWSIIAVDRKTGEIGVAGASCTFDVSGIASIIPGKGAIVVQAASSYFARKKGEELMLSNASLEAILNAMKDKQYNPERQQYGVILLNNNPLVYSGTQIKNWYGEKTANDFAVLGNILPDSSVVESAYKAFNSSRHLSLSDRLMNALKAGEQSGGDKRCGNQYARSAFISVYNPLDKAILKLSVSGIEKEGKPAVSILKNQYTNWKNKDIVSVQNNKMDSIKKFNGKHISKVDMDEFIHRQMSALEIPGLSIAFINEDQVVYHTFKGVTNIETQIKVNERTFFDAASMSKTVFSVFVMRMIDQGLLNLDTPLYKYLEYPDIAYDDRYKQITARMVLSHTSGFPNLRFIGDDGVYNPNNKLTIKFKPGTQFLYSGEGYQYLANVVAHLKGVKKNELQTIIKSEIFDPLNMGESSFVWNDYLEGHRANGHFKGKVNSGWASSSNNSNFNAAASLQTNSKYFSNFLIALMNNTLLSNESYEELLKIQSTSAATKTSKERFYGLGVVIEKSKSGTNYLHGGDNMSSTAQYMFNRNQKVGYVFFTNSEKKKVFNQKLLEFLKD